MAKETSSQSTIVYEQKISSSSQETTKTTFIEHQWLFIKVYHIVKANTCMKCSTLCEIFYWRDGRKVVKNLRKGKDK